MRKKTVDTLLREHGVSSTIQIQSVKDKLKNPLSTAQLVESILQSRYKFSKNVDYIREHPLGPYLIDFYVPSANLLIECQGDYFHDFKKYGYSGTPQDRSKASYIENHSTCSLVWIYEHELHIGRLAKILDHHIHKEVANTVSVDLKRLDYKQIKNQEAHVFLTQYHYLGNLGCVSTSFGAFFENDLVSVCIFGGVTRNLSIKKVNNFTNGGYGPKDLRELRRFCIKPGASVKNMGSYCIKRFIQLYESSCPNVRAIMSFADTSVFDIGTIYKASGWIKLGDASPSYHYIDSQTRKFIHKRTVWGLAKGAHMSEIDFADSAGLIRVDEKLKSVWLKEL
jgi:hypothetical protein